MNLGEWIREQRTRRELTQAELARLATTDAGSVSRWEHGKVTPDLESFRKLCVVFGASADKVLGLSAHAARRRPPARCGAPA